MQCIYLEHAFTNLFFPLMTNEPIFFFFSEIFCEVIFLKETACLLKARGWPRSWQMSGPWAAQNLQMPYPRNWQGGHMPRSSPGGGGWAQLEVIMTDALPEQITNESQKHIFFPQGWKEYIFLILITKWCLIKKKKTFGNMFDMRQRYSRFHSREIIKIVLG